ncbi:hypothetical protein [Diaphorobacter aerolatus]|uniref:Uncharacterized protein n=1 Tax=Diaphorobacter aerolatus TaxID=1288495 RepID=A0A7H0GMK3_9BURK|nr:hypothetical protein [Diaphorobacter aerolatus]QNP49519.1 hypothetical protein H9K75_05865 [Diaphorobacter aerolatus]
MRNIGSKSRNASRVAGSEPLKITTPKRPFHQPSELEFLPTANTIACPQKKIARLKITAAPDVNFMIQYNQNIVMDTLITQWQMLATRSW